MRWTADQHDAWKAREASRANNQRPSADAANRPTPPETKPPTMARRADRTPGGAEAVRAPIYPLVGLCRAAGLPEPVPEYRWHPVRKFRADYAIPLHRILIEIDGGAMLGYCAIGKLRIEIMPASMITIATTQAKIGRSMKKRAINILLN